VSDWTRDANASIRGELSFVKRLLRPRRRLAGAPSISSVLDGHRAVGYWKKRGQSFSVIIRHREGLRSPPNGRFRECRRAGPYCVERQKRASLFCCVYIRCGSRECRRMGSAQRDGDPSWRSSMETVAGPKIELQHTQSSIGHTTSPLNRLVDDQCLLAGRNLR